jgi:addiction module HigA family antidote
MPTAKDPGSVLKSFLEAYQLNPSRLAAAVKLSQSTVRQITLNKMKISIPVALRFAKFFGNPVKFWIDTQLQYDLTQAAKDSKLSTALKAIQKAKKPAPGKKPAAKTVSARAEKKPVSKKKRSTVKKAGRPAAKTAKKPGRKPRAKK